MTIAVDLGRKATKPTNQPTYHGQHFMDKVQYLLDDCMSIEGTIALGCRLISMGAMDHYKA